MHVHFVQYIQTIYFDCHGHRVTSTCYITEEKKLSIEIFNLFAAVQVINYTNTVIKLPLTITTTYHNCHLPPLPFATINTYNHYHLPLLTVTNTTTSRQYHLPPLPLTTTYHNYCADFHYHFFTNYHYHLLPLFH